MEKYFLVKAKTVQVTEKGKVKKVTEQYLVEANDVVEAEKIFNENFVENFDVIYECEIASISETKILDVFYPEK